MFQTKGPVFRMSTFYQQIDKNKQLSLIIVMGFIGFITAASWIMAYAFDTGFELIGFALIFAGLTSFFSYYFSDRIILSISKAKPATREDHFDFYTVAENVAMAARIPLPKLYVIDDSAINAFATGRDPKHAVVCVTSGLLERLDRTEIEGVVGHEISHIRNYDMRLMSLVTILVGTITLLADWILRANMYRSSSNRKNQSQATVVILLVGVLLSLLSPLIATIIKLAISRRREFLADASAVELTRYPEGLKRALEKIAQDSEPLEVANKATAHLYICNPLKNHHDQIGWFAKMFSTHPPIQERIAALTP